MPFERTIQFQDGRSSTVQFEREPTAQDIQEAADHLDRSAQKGGPAKAAGPAKQPAQEGWGQWGAAQAARVGLPILGALSPIPGGALMGGAAGEALAEKIEGRPLDPADIAIGGVLGAIPIPGAKIEGQLAKRALIGAGGGAALGGGQYAAHQLTHGQPVEAGGLAKSTAVGAGIGAAGHAVWGPRPFAETPRGAASAKLDTAVQQQLQQRAMELSSQFGGGMPAPKAPPAPAAPIAKAAQLAVATKDTQGFNALAASEGMKRGLLGLFTSRGPSIERETGRAIISRQEGLRRRAPVDEVMPMMQEVGDRIERLLPTDEHKMAFNHRFEMGQEQPTPELQAYAHTLRNLSDTLIEQPIREAGKRWGMDLLVHARADYLPHILKNKVNGETAYYIPPSIRKSMTGTHEFLKQRTFETLQDAYRNGFEPVTWNPVGLFAQRLTQASRFSAGMHEYADLRDIGNLPWHTGPLPPSYGEINDRAARILPPPKGARRGGGEAGEGEGAEGYEISQEKQALREGTADPDARQFRRGGPAGRYIAPLKTANDINRHMSPGFSRGMRTAEAGGDIAYDFMQAQHASTSPYDMVREAVNSMNQMRFGFSFFHAVFEGFNDAANGMTEGIYQLGRGSRLRGAERTGAWKEAARGFATAHPLHLVSRVQEGRQMFRQFHGLEDYGPEVAKKVQNWIESGGSFSQSRLYIDRQAQAFAKSVESLKQGDLWHGLPGLARAPLAVAEQLAKPLFEKIVPYAKIAAGSARVEAVLRELGPKADRLEVLRRVNRELNNIDDIYGQLNYESLYMDNKWKQAMHVAFQAPGWTIGTVRQVAGGLMDLVSGKGLTRRAAFVGALPITAFLYATTLEALLNGGKVQLDSPYDKARHMFGGFVHSRNPDGTANWLSIPSYMKDEFHWINGMDSAVAHGDNREIAAYAQGKLSPLVEAVSEVAWNNKFPGRQLRDPHDPLFRQFVDISMGVAQTMFMPFSVGMFEQAHRQSPDSPFALGVFSALGFAPASRYLAMSAAATEVDRILSARHATMPISKKAAARRDVKSEVVQALREGRPIDGFKVAQLPPAQLKSAIRQGRMGRFEVQAGMLSVPELLQVWGKAKVEVEENERTIIQRTLQQKLVRSGGKWMAALTDPRERTQVMSALNQFLKDATVKRPVHTVEDKPVQQLGVP